MSVKDTLIAMAAAFDDAAIEAEKDRNPPSVKRGVMELERALRDRAQMRKEIADALRATAMAHRKAAEIL